MLKHRDTNSEEATPEARPDSYSRLELKEKIRCRIGNPGAAAKSVEKKRSTGDLGSSCDPRFMPATGVRRSRPSSVVSADWLFVTGAAWSATTPGTSPCSAVRIALSTNFLDDRDQDELAV